ncbi:anti-sigma factor domain-containing protein [Psychrobacillus sp. PGGUH221]|uniref:anti-sigma factor domain-containing protein n=1 Tax=Psychrobacillus sp. PGGUH221 TaxID=3020058 RepID=UPI0035C74631
MRTYKGIVCEKKTKYMIFLTKEGKFLRGVPIISNPEIGQEVEFRLMGETILSRKWTKPSFLAPVIVAAMFLLFVIASFIPNPGTALAYVQLDANNSVELGVDQEGLVVTLRSLNDTAPIMLEDWEGNPVDIVLSKVVKQLSPLAKEIAITTIYENNKESSDMKEIIEVAVEEVQSEHTEKVWIVNESTIEEREEADKHDKSIQKLKEVENDKIKDNLRNNGVPVNQESNMQKIPSNNNQNKIDEQSNKEKQQEQQEKIEQKQQEQQEKVKQQQEKIKEKQEIQKEKLPEQKGNQQNSNGKSTENQAKEMNKEKENQQKDAEKTQKENEKSQKDQEKNNNGNGNSNGNNNGNGNN